MPENQPSLQAVLDQLPVMMVTYDANRNLVSANREALHTLGWPRTELSSVDLFAECYPKNATRQQVLTHIWAADGSWRDFTTQARYGATLDISWTGMRLADGQYFGIGRNVTQQKQAEAALRENEEQFRLMFEMAPIGLVMCELDGRLQHVNGSFAGILGRSSKELLRANWRDLIHPEDRENYYAEMYHVVSGERPGFRVQWRYLRGDGGTVIGLTQATAVGDDHKRPLFLVIQVEDITDHIRAEGDRDALIQQLENKNTELESYTYTISHDLKNPLITIKGFLGPLRKNAAAGKVELLEPDIERIAGAANKMEQLLDELLELSRIGRVVNSYEEVSLMSLAQEAVDLVFQPVDRPSIYVQISAQLPSVRVDRLRILQVYRHLLDNAIKFMRNSSRPWIHVGVRRDEVEGIGTEHVFYVRDSGTGIDPRYLKKVFGLFNQVDPLYGGTGIGLTLAKRIIDVHGGRIWAESKGVDQGATICFTLPQSPSTP